MKKVAALRFMQVLQNKKNYKEQNEEVFYYGRKRFYGDRNAFSARNR